MGIIWCTNILLKAYVGTLKQIQQYFEMTLPPPSSSKKSLEISQKLFCWDKNPHISLQPPQKKKCNTANPDSTLRTFFQELDYTYIRLTCLGYDLD